MGADKIFVLKDGKVAEEGTHELLLQKENGVYKKMWEDYLNSRKEELEGL